jgi:putative oxidoreductase
MSLSRRIARPLLASMFVVGGADSLRYPEGKVKMAEKVTRPMSEHIEALPDDAALLVRINGGVQVTAALLLSVGKFRRLAALALIGSIIPTTYAGHRFWEELDEEKRTQQRIHFLKNLGLLGGLILAAFDTEGVPSLSWRLGRRLDRSGSNGKRRVPADRHPTKRVVKGISETGSKAWREVEDFAGGVTKSSERAAALLSQVPLQPTSA